MKAIYGVYGMMEWEAVIPTRSNKVKISFTGGSLSGYGTTPAKFVTTNPAIIHLIESSPQFRSGRIRLLHREADPLAGTASEPIVENMPEESSPIETPAPIKKIKKK
ncbi:MAG: hypothetical protein HDS79_01375 [Bacteroidales bacterium]|nr:hypothetical protein [Bacteroidales bacterium]MDE7466614.1 hypothetical protein [Muribaculaceae bacterium]